MSYQDDDKLIFPTRTGAPIGPAAERQMLDNAQGSATISKRIRKNLDGSVTRLTTRAGNPEFITERDSEDKIDVCPLTDYGFVNSKFNINDAYSFPEDLSRPIYNLFGADGLIKEAKHARNSVKRKRSLMLQAAPLFSGMMRRVVQLENGKKKGVRTGETPPLEEGESPFKPGWSVTDGLFIGEKNDGTPTRFVIRIDSSGIWRIPISFCKKIKKGWADDEALWRAQLTSDQFHKKISPYWTAVKFDVTKKVKIAPPPTCFADGFAPFYEWCGWAFDYTGSKATVVCTGFKNSSDTWLTNRLYDLTVLSENGVPYYATESVSREDKFVNPYNDATPNEPTAALQAATMLPGYMNTYQFHDAITYKSGAPNQDAPAFSYFEKGGNKVVVSLYLKNGTTGTSVSYMQTRRARHYDPAGVFLQSYYDSAQGKAVTVEYSPISAFDVPDDGILSTGPYSRQVTGSTGKTDVSFYSDHVDKSSETYSVTNVDIDLEDAGFGYKQGTADGPRLVSESLTFCLSNQNMYLSVGGYERFSNAGINYDATIRCAAITRQVNYVWQASSTYSKVQTDRTVLLLHGFDRESYSVARSRYQLTGEKTTTRSATGSVAPATVMPIAGLNLEFADGSVVEWQGIGNSFPNVPGLPDKVVVGNAVSENVIGKVVTRNADLGVSGGTQVTGSVSSSEMTITTRVGETTYTENIKNDDVFLTHTGGDLIMFRACAAAFDCSRQVRQKEINSDLITESIGGCKPSSEITTFIGVF